MQTNFSLAQLADPAMATSEKILRTCVHCGFCTATCPTYLLLGDELDSPRGRIYLIKDMLEGGKAASRRGGASHVDRCLSCLSCMTTCPSGVHYMHLVDHARSAHRGDLLARAASTTAFSARSSPSCCPIPTASGWRCWAAKARQPRCKPLVARSFRGSATASPRCSTSPRPRCRDGQADQPARHLSAGPRPGHKKSRAAAGLRPERAAAGLQRGGDPAAQPARGRGGARGARAAAGR